MDRTIELPRATRAAEVRAASFDEAENTIEVIWTTGAAVRRRSWENGPYDEELVVEPGAVRLERLNAGAPFLDTHASYELEYVIGAVVPGSARIENGRGVAAIKLSSAPRDVDTVSKIRDGIIRNVSVGYIVHRVEKVESDDGSVPVWRVVDWEPMEISAVPIPADPGAQIRSGEVRDARFPAVLVEPGCPAAVIRARMAMKARDHDFQKYSSRRLNSPARGGDVSSCRDEESSMGNRDNQAAELRNVVSELIQRANQKLAELTDDVSAEMARQIEKDHDAIMTELEEAKRSLADAENTPPATETRAVDLETGARAAREAVEVERKRVADITQIGREFSLGDDFVGNHIRNGTQIGDFRAAVLETLVAKQEKHGGPQGGAHNRSIEVGQDETQTRRDAMVEYIMARNNAGQMTERAAGMYRGFTAIDLVKEALEWKGEKTRGLLPDEIAQRGLHTTSDFPAILANVANKTLRAAYQARPRTFTAWTRRMMLSDFKTYNILRRGETPQLALVNEKGEFKRGTITESKETIQLKTYGVVVGLTRQAIINDDLGALVGIPSDFATSAASLESDLVYGLLLSNPTMGDSTALFHANHKNLAASGTAIDITPLSVMRANMSKQTGLDGVTVINAMANFLIVPPELETRADQLFSAVIPSVNTAAVPNWVRSLTPISEARLSVGVANAGAGITASGSATRYYLASTDVDTIVTATLDGRDGPYVESRIGFDVDGVEIKCRHDFGAAVADWRGLQLNPGA